MRGVRRWLAAGVGVVLVGAGCTRTEGAPTARAVVPPPAQAVERPADLTRELAAAQASIVARADSARAVLVSVPGLSRGERAELRRDVNAAQIATARSLGVRAGGDSSIERLVRQGQLVELEDSTRYWVLRDLEHSVPYVTPDTRQMLLEVGRRFHARLDSLGLPRYRIQVTSVLRTPQSQARLRSRNSNAARGVSAHEFGTTVDVAHVRFAPPAVSELTVELPSDPRRTSTMRYVEALVLQEVGRKHAHALQAELGRVLHEMRGERKLRVMMERRQAVYHMTVARHFPRTAQAD